MEVETVRHWYQTAWTLWHQPNGAEMSWVWTSKVSVHR